MAGCVCVRIKEGVGGQELNPSEPRPETTIFLGHIYTEELTVKVFLAKKEGREFKEVRNNWPLIYSLDLFPETLRI